MNAQVILCVDLYRPAEQITHRIHESSLVTISMFQHTQLTSLVADIGIGNPQRLYLKSLRIRRMEA
jgi:hypothetical protein